MKLFRAEISELATFAKSMTSDRNSALLPANVDLPSPYSEVFAAIENCEIARWLNVNEPYILCKVSSFSKTNSSKLLGIMSSKCHN